MRPSMCESYFIVALVELAGQSVYPLKKFSKANFPHVPATIINFSLYNL